MSAPKKIWLHKDFWGSCDSDYWTEEKKEQGSEKGDEYIRADIVEEMREALEALMTFSRLQENDVLIKDAQAALKRLEGG